MIKGGTFLEIKDKDLKPELRCFSLINVLSEHSPIFSIKRKQSEARLAGASSRNARISQDGMSV